MSAARQTSIDRLARMRERGAAGQVIEADDAGALAGWLDRAVAGNITIDAAAGLRAGWQESLGRRIARLAAWAEGGGSYRQAAKELHSALGRYVDSGRFDQHLAGVTKPDGKDAELFRIALANRGQVPSEEKLRKGIASAVAGLSP